MNACTYLIFYTEYSYTEISKILKYSSEGSMNRDFIKEFNCTPSEAEKYLSKFDKKNIKLPNVSYLIKI